MTPDKILYTAHATVTGAGREGTARTPDGALDLALSTPRGLGGAGGAGTNPEQLFAAGYAACFLSAIRHVASQQKTSVPADTSVSAAVGIGPGATGYCLTVELSVQMPGAERATAEALVAAAHAVCPYSNATRGNIDVSLRVV